MKTKAFSLIEVKELNDELRVIRGIATTPRVDRVGDVVEPLGVKVAADIPLMLHHDHKLVVGRAKFGTPTKAGIPFEATIPKVDEDGAVKSRVDEAWHSVKYRLITAVSIGFQAVSDKVERLADGGLRFLETEVYELSLVPVPAQPDAIIQQFKSMSDETFLRAFNDSADTRASAGNARPANAADDSGQSKRGPVRLAKSAAPRKPLTINVTPRKTQ